MSYSRHLFPRIHPAPSFIGELVAANNTLTCGVHASALNRDVAVCVAIDDANGTYSISSGGTLLTTEVAGSAVMLGQAWARVADNTHTFTWSGTASSRRGHSFTFRGMPYGVYYSIDGGGTGTSATIPAMPVKYRNSIAVVALIVNAASQTFTPSITPALTAGTLGSATITSRPYYAINVNNFAGGTISWGSSAAYVWCACLAK